MLGADGTIDTIEGTTIHPIWSIDRDDWVPFGELEEGEQLLSSSGTATILTHQVFHRTTPVYNIEIHGEHVYQVGALGLLVHNACPHVDGGIATTKNVLDGAIKFLKCGHRDMGRGRFLSKDGLRQIRWGKHELNPLDMHINFEHYDLPWDIGGKVIESTFTLLR